MPLTSEQLTSPYFALCGKSKRPHWDPADVDLSADRAQSAVITKPYITPAPQAVMIAGDVGAHRIRRRA